jgi:hypothetical protein
MKTVVLVVVELSRVKEELLYQEKETSVDTAPVLALLHEAEVEVVQEELVLTPHLDQLRVLMEELVYQML